MTYSKKWMLFIAGALLVYHFDVITGSWKFNRLCKNEGGPRFYGPVEKNVGWEVADNDTYSYQGPFSFGDVAFVRYQDKRGVRSDVRMEGYKQTSPNYREPNYVFSPVDESLTARYRFKSPVSRMPNDDRFGISKYEVTEIETGKMLASYTRFGFSWTQSERVILGAPTGKSCPDGSDDATSYRAFDKNIYEFRSK